MPQVDIQITDEFTDNNGQFGNYDAIPLNQRTQLRKQKHTDIRLFHPETVSVTPRMLHLDQLAMNTLDGMSMGQLSVDGDAVFILDQGESWTAGTVDRDPTKNNWGTIELTCPNGATTITQSVMRF
jgi:hypothetical protein